jgi:hypothetical protein
LVSVWGFPPFGELALERLSEQVQGLVARAQGLLVLVPEPLELELVLGQEQEQALEQEQVQPEEPVLWAFPQCSELLL